MKTSIAGAVLTSTLICAMPALAQDVPQPPAPPSVPAVEQAPAAPVPPAAAKPEVDPVLLKAYMGLMRDIGTLTSHRLTLKQRVDAARGFQLSGDTKAAFQQVFGNGDPLHISVTDLPDGGASVHGQVDTLDYKDPNSGAVAHFGSINGEVVVDRDFGSVSYSANWPGMQVDNAQGKHIAMFGNATLTGQGKPGPANFLVGKLSGKLDQMVFGTPGEGFALTMNDFTVTADVAVRKNMFDASYDYRLASVDWGKDKVTDLNFDLGLTNLDAKALEALVEIGEDMKGDDKLSDAQLQSAIKVFKQLGLGFSRHNGAFEIHDISARYHGYKAGISGRVWLANLKPADVESLQKAYEKLQVRIRLHVPTAMIDDIAHTVARIMMEQQARQSGAQVTDVAVDLVARGVTSKMSEVLLKQQKWAHMEKDEMVSVFELKRGKLYLDGHKVDSKANPFMAMAQGK